ncbi:hypothetical protein CTAYLR_010744 [Chrysophaeum taylorii]|uniref:RING-type domain-containing protein n=1 Tax=Chrysophaeum taylorii TaxID=2483200 RepID=A0AAD7U5P2_9STRA|nr:hypothetical protein CTAYLR_010744 [Chrysophaeum taylorii]
MAEDEEARRESGQFSSEAEFSLDHDLGAVKRSVLGTRRSAESDEEDEEFDEEVYAYSEAEKPSYDELEAIVSALREELRCAVCRRAYRDPISLACGHSFCRGCARKLVVDAHPRKPPCPVCRTPLRPLEDEEALTCVALRNCVRIVERRGPRAPNPPEETDDHLIVTAASAPPPSGWHRVSGFRNGVVVATRTVSRDPPYGSTMRLCLALRFLAEQRRSMRRDALDARLFFPDDEGTVYFERIGVAVLRVEEDEHEDPGCPWLLEDPQDDELVARDQDARTIVLRVHPEGDVLTSTLLEGECSFDHVSLGFEDEWTEILVSDAVTALEYKIAFRLFRRNEHHQPEEEEEEEEEEEDEEEEEEEDDYDRNDGFIVDEEEEEQEEEEQEDRQEDLHHPDDRHHITHTDDEDEDEIIQEEEGPPPPEVKRRRIIEEEEDEGE